MMARTQHILRRERMNITLETLLEQFVTTKATENRIPKTLSWYKQMIRGYIGFVRNGEEPLVKDFTIGNARTYVASLQSRTTRYDNHPYRQQTEGGLSPRTIHAHVRALKVFSSWLEEEGYTKSNILYRVKRPKLPETRIQVLSKLETETLLSVIKPNCFLGARQYLIIVLLLDTGMRATELCEVKLSDVSLSDNSIKVMGKGQKERLVYFGMRTKKYLERYLTTWRGESEEENLLLSVDGTPLTYEGLSHSAKGLGQKCGIPRLHAHLLRHTFAVNYLVNGGDLMSLRLILGHTDISVKPSYT